MPDGNAAITRICQACGGRIPRTAPGGQCPACLMRLALQVIDEPDFDGGRLLDAGQVREFGAYELIDEIARGGMGVIYRATERKTGREVALKMLLSGQLAASHVVARFRKEAAAAAMLDHPNIVPVYEFGEVETQHFIAMRFIPGNRNIAHWARSLPRANRLRAIALAIAEVARAIDYAHQQGVLHRDLKPSNILIDENEEPQITDFGLAKLLDDPDSTVLTQTAAILGSPSYMAPEQAEPGGRGVTAATDIYGLGAILYELTSGRPPFVGATPLIIVRRVVEEAPRRLADVPENLDTICRKCLAKDPARRYSSARELAEELERFARGEQILAEPEGSLAQLRGWARRNPAVAVLLIALLLSLAIGFVSVVGQWHRAQLALAEVASANSRLKSTIGHLEWRQIGTLIDRDYAPRAVAELASRLRSDAKSWQAASYAISILEQRPFSIPAGPALTLPPGAPAPRAVLDAEGRWVAYVAAKGRCRVVDAATWQDAIPPVEMAAEVVRVLFSPDRKRFIIGTEDGVVTIYELPSGRLLSRTRTLAHPLRDLQLSADGQAIVVAGGSFVSIGLMSDFLAGQAPLRNLDAGFTPAETRCSADGRRGIVWGRKTGDALLSFGAPGESGVWAVPVEKVRRASLDRAGRRLAVQTGPTEVQVWDTEGRRKLTTIDTGYIACEMLEVTPDGERVALGLVVGEVRIYSAVTGQLVALPMRQLYSTTALVLDRTGEQVATGATDFKVRMWHARTGLPAGEPIPHRGPVAEIALSADRSSLLSLSEENGKAIRYLQVWRLRRPVEPRTYDPGARNMDACAMSPDGRYLAIAAELPQPVFSVVEKASGRVMLRQKLEREQAYGARFSPDSGRLYMVTNRGSCFGWSVPEMQPLWPPLLLDKVAQPSACPPDVSVVGLGCVDGMLRIVDHTTGRLVSEFNHGAGIKGVRFTADGARVLSAGVDGKIRVWNVRTGENLATLTGHRDRVISAIFSPDGNRIASASYDSTARLWDAWTGRPLGNVMPHSGEMSHVTFSPDGLKIGTASRDGTARIWDGFTGRPLIEPIDRLETVQTVEFHSDGRRFLTQDQGAFRLWDVQTGEAVTVDYPARVGGGIGIDSDCVRRCFSPDGQSVLLGHGLKMACLWKIQDPPTPVPEWFPDFLDLIATAGMGRPGRDETQPGAPLLDFMARARSFGDESFYDRWVRRYLRLTEEETLR